MISLCVSVCVYDEVSLCFIWNSCFLESAREVTALIEECIVESLTEGRSVSVALFVSLIESEIL